MAIDGTHVHSCLVCESSRISLFNSASNTSVQNFLPDVCAHLFFAGTFVGVAQIGTADFVLLFI